MHRSGRQQLLEVRTRQAAIATLAQSKAPDALREAALDARPERIFLFALGRLLALAGGLPRLMVGLGPDSALPWGVCRCGAPRPGGTGATGSPVKPAPTHRSARDVVAWRPFATGKCLGKSNLVF
jgi:hypothetical protein